MKHTPGPFTTEGVHGEALHEIILDYQVEGQGFPIVIASVNYDHPDDGEPFITLEQANANARLFAAAPDLLAVCEKIERYILSLPHAYQDHYAVPRACLLGDVRTAIAKAKGES